MCEDVKRIAGFDSPPALERKGKIEMEPLNKKEIREQLEEVKSIVENEVHPVVSPDNWYVYASLHDELEQLEILLKHCDVI